MPGVGELVPGERTAIKLMDKIQNKNIQNGFGTPFRFTLDSQRDDRQVQLDSDLCADQCDWCWRRAHWQTGVFSRGVLAVSGVFIFTSLFNVVTVHSLQKSISASSSLILLK